MKQTLSPIAKILDSVAIFFLFFILSFIFLLKFTSSLLLCLIISILLSCALTLLFSHILSIFSSTHSKNLAKNTKIENMLTSFKFMSPKTLHSFWKSALSKNFKLDSRHKDKLIIKTNSKTIYFTYNFSGTETSLVEILSALDFSKSQNALLYFLSPTFSQDALLLIKTEPSLTLLDANKTYSLLEKLNAESLLPPPPIKQGKQQKILIKNLFSKRNIPSFIRFSLLFFVLSLILPLSSYYKFFALFFLLLAALSLIIKEKKPLPTTLPPELFP